MRGWGEDGREDDGRRHDDDEEGRDQEAAEVRFDGFDHAMHEVENSKAAADQDIGCAPDRSGLQDAAGRTADAGLCASDW